MQDSHSFFDVFQQYFAESIVLSLFVIALVWITKRWKTEYKRKVCAILCGCVLIFNELVYRIFVVVGESITYYRLFWCVPIVFVISIFMVEIIFGTKKSGQVLSISIMLIAVLIISRQTGEEWFAFPENIYQVDEDVIQVADKLMELTDGEPTYLLDNGDLYMSIRQYDARIMYTNNEQYGLWGVIEGISQNVLGSDVMQATYEDRSRYLALCKDEPLPHKLVESAGHTLVANTDNYKIYNVDYDTVHWDEVKRAELSTGRINQVTIEYINVPNVRERCGYVYITDFGGQENEEKYQELLAKIQILQPQGIIINDQLSINSGWYLKYEDLLAEIQIPYYCNNQELQVIEEDEYLICMMDNVNGIVNETLEKFRALTKEEKPIILVLSSKVEEVADELYAVIVETDVVVQVLSARQCEYTKDLLGERVLQYAAPVDENQIFSLIYLKELENVRVVPD